MANGSDRSPDGYRRVASPAINAEGALPGPRIRADVVDVYIVRAAKPVIRLDDEGTDGSGPGLMDLELLQLLRTKPPLHGTWQPVMGHIEQGETAVQAAVREMLEEVNLAPASPHFGGMWALEQVHPFYIPQIDCIVMSPRFVVMVDRAWEPRLNSEHGDARWVSSRGAAAEFMWPGQHAAITELRGLLHPGHLAHVRQRLL